MKAKEPLVSLEDYRIAFGELEASNAVLVSANAELRSTKERLEEAVRKLNLHVRETDTAHMQLERLVEGCRAPILLLDRDLTICAYTAAASEIFKLIPTDRGRPLTDVGHSLAYPDLETDLRAVIDTGDGRIRRVPRIEGRLHYLVSIRPARWDETGVQGAALIFTDITSLVRAEEQKNVLIAELNHRVKNMLAVIIAIARQTIRRAPTAELFYEAFTARLHAMARTYELLSRESWSEVDLVTLVQQELNPYTPDGGGRTSFGGPHVMLKPKAALSLGLIFHELATNAAKYGALSNATGHVSLTWTREERPLQRNALVLRWSERDGPPVTVPEKSGFGLGLVRNEAKYSLRGKANIRFDPAGLLVELEIPLSGAP